MGRNRKLVDESFQLEYNRQHRTGRNGLYGAKKGKKAAKQAAASTQPLGYSTGSQFGSTTVDPRTRQMQFSMGQNPFAQLFNVGGMGALANAYSAPGSAYYGAPKEVTDAANAMYGPEMQAQATQRLGQLRELAQPEEARQTQSLNDRLFAMGRLGGTEGAVEQQALADAHRRADLERTMMSQDWAQQALQRFQTATSAVGTGAGLQQQQFGIGQQSQGGLADMFRLLLEQGRTGLGAAAPVAPGAAVYGAEASTAPWQAGAEFLKNSGVFNKIGDWVGNKWGAPATTTPSPYGPMSGGYQFPAQTQPFNILANYAK